jgi:bacillithiol biosynthesis cysteine-adding enzyme BshC
VPRPPGPPLRLSLPERADRCSVAHCALPPEVDALVEQLAQALAEQPEAERVVALVRDAYRPGRSLPEAFARLLAAVFAEEGLVLLDPRCHEVAQLFAPYYRIALSRADEIDNALLQRGEELARAGLEEQVHVRRGSPLVFFHPEGVEGPRHRLQRDGARYRLDAGGQVAPEELLAAAEREPLRLSTSALLRPLVQDALLPAVVYVGGPAELGYLAQVAPLYPIFGVRPSLAAPRARFRLIDARTASLLGKLALAPKDVELPREKLMQRLGARSAGLTAPDELARALLGELPSRISALAEGRPALARTARRARSTVERAAARFAGRHAQLLAEEDSVLSERATRLQHTLFPEGAPQERVHSLPYYAAHHGLSALKSAVLSAIVPGESAVQDLSP